MSGAWYEEQGPTTDEVREKLTAVYLMPKYTYRLVKLTTIKNIINNVISAEEKQHGGWGSYRGYYTFTHNNLIKAINKQVQRVMEKNARNKINHFIMNSYWVQDLLYRPPTKNRAAGRMYTSVQSHFKELVNDENTPKLRLSEI